MINEIAPSIDCLDFRMIIKKMVTEQNWTHKEAMDGILLYKNFLMLKKKYGSLYEILPSEDIDEVWHNHILDTKKYEQDCQLIFGNYIHHYPYYGMDDKTTHRDALAAFEITQKLHMQEFGYYIFPVRARKLIRIIRRIFKN